jgi:hypothetical protein
MISNLSKMKNKIRILLTVALAGLPLLSEGQTFVLSKTGTAIAIRGTSSLHDWEMDLTSFNSDLLLNQEGSLIMGFDNVTFSCKATDIKSESSLMDKKAYDALKADYYPYITFTGISGTGLVTRGNGFTGNLKGKLNIAGKTKDVTIPFDGNFTDSKTINIVASADLNMSSFNIIPPTAMFGALKTGDEITVSFSLQFVQKSTIEGSSY